MRILQILPCLLAGLCSLPFAALADVNINGSVRGIALPGSCNAGPIDDEDKVISIDLQTKNIFFTCNDISYGCAAEAISGTTLAQLSFSDTPSQFQVKCGAMSAISGLQFTSTGFYTTLTDYIAEAPAITICDGGCDISDFAYNANAGLFTYYVTPTTDPNDSYLAGCYLQNSEVPVWDEMGTTLSLDACVNAIDLQTGQLILSNDAIVFKDSFGETSVTDDGPTISEIVNQTVSESSDPSATSVNFTVNDDMDAVLLTVKVNSSRPLLIPTSQVVLGGSGTNRTAMITPAENRDGESTITITVTDGDGNHASSSFLFTVTDSNLAPITSDDSYEATEDALLQKDATLGVLANDSEPDGDAFTALLVTDVSHGVLALEADGSFAYTPALNFNGTDMFTYKACDDQDKCSAATTVTLTVTPVNDAPVATASSVTLAAIDEDNSRSFSLSFTDVDGDEDELTYGATVSATHGLVTGTVPDQLIYTPSSNYHGDDTFTFRACDAEPLCATTTYTITMNAVNDAPVAQDDAFSTPQTTELTINYSALLANDSDVDEDSLVIQSVGFPSAGFINLGASALVYTPSVSANVDDVVTFIYTIFDGSVTATGTVSITITEIPNNMPVADDIAVPVFNEDAASGIITLSATDADVGDTLVFAISVAPAHGSLGDAGDSDDTTYVYTPNANYCGADSFNYSVSDSKDTVTATVNIMVSCDNDPPTIIAIDDQIMTEDQSAPLTVGYSVSDVDIATNGDSIMVSVGSSNGNMVLNTDNLDLSNTSGSGQLTIMLPENAYGTKDITITVIDGNGSSDTTTFTLTVNGVNDAPAPMADSYTTDYQTPLTVVDLDGVLSNDTDADGDNLTATLISGTNVGGSVTFDWDNTRAGIEEDGGFIYFPDSGFSGEGSFNYRACDNNICITQTVTITVNAQTP